MADDFELLSRRESFSDQAVVDSEPSFRGNSELHSAKQEFTRFPGRQVGVVWSADGYRPVPQVAKRDSRPELSTTWRQWQTCPLDLLSREQYDVEAMPIQLSNYRVPPTDKNRSQTKCYGRIC